MAFKLTTSKETAIKAFISEWVRDPLKFCDNCGNLYQQPPEGCEWDKCCDDPYVVTNVIALYMNLQQNKIWKNTRDNKFASNEDKNIRWGVSMHAKLMHDLEEYCRETLKDPFWSETHDMKEMEGFMGSFPQFRVCETV